MDASILIPVYNEQEILSESLNRLNKYLDLYGLDCEIIVCSNGSTDGTEDIGKVLEEKYPKLTFIKTDERGVGWAFRKMVETAKTNKLVSVDADLTTDMGFIPQSIKLLDDYDIVVGSKRMGEQNRPLTRIIISKTFIGLVKLLLGLYFGDYSIGAKAYRKDKITPYTKKIDHGSSYVIEVIYYVKAGNNVIEIPVVCSDSRGSKFNIIDEISYRAVNLFRFWWAVK
ncbi:MAG: glycosyltransferase [Candidatus Altiarchaeales archaeon]|nr:glycosyltransferase [Candidatus Altiarchaeales archaeon]